MRIHPRHPISPGLLLAATVALSVCSMAEATAGTVVLGVAPQPRLSPAADQQAVAAMIQRLAGVTRRVGETWAGIRPSTWRHHWPTPVVAAIIAAPSSQLVDAPGRFVGLYRAAVLAASIPVSRPHLIDLPPPALCI